MQGYIKDHRQELASDIWAMPPLYHRLWQWLKYKANHDDASIPMADGSRLLIKRGQHLTSVRKIANGIGWYERGLWKEPNPKTVNELLNWLTDAGMITLENGNRKYTLVTLVNWALFQISSDESNAKVTVSIQSLGINKNEKNEKNEEKKEEKKKTSSRKRTVYEIDSIPYRSASYLLTKIREHTPSIKEPNLQQWANDMRLMLETDKREPNAVATVIDWATSNSFWQSNILSASKLREKFETLQSQMNRDKVIPLKPQQQSNYQRTQTELQRIRAEAEEALQREQGRNYDAY